MMKKIIAILIAAILALSATAFAATYTNRDRDMTFEYDDALFKVNLEEENDDDVLVILAGKDEAWGETIMSFELSEVNKVNQFPKVEDFAGLSDDPADAPTQGEWNGFRDVIMYGNSEGELHASNFFVPVYDDDDNEIEEILHVEYRVSPIEDEAVAKTRDDAISAILDSLKLIDD